MGCRFCNRKSELYHHSTTPYPQPATRAGRCPYPRQGGRGQEIGVKGVGLSLLKRTRQTGWMDLIYIDESGDPGASNSPTNVYFLSSLNIPCDQWARAQSRLMEFRHRMRDQMGLKLSAEIHAAEFLGGAKHFLGLEPRQRLRIALWLLREIQGIQGCRSRTIGMSKSKGTDIVRSSWIGLATLLTDGSSNSSVLIADMGETETIRRAMEEFRSQQTRQAIIVESPFHRDSRHSFFLQAVDLIAYLHRQRHHPNGLFRANETVELFEALDSLAEPVSWMK